MTKKPNGRRTLRAVFDLNEDREFPWNEEDFIRWITENLNKKAAAEWIVRIRHVDFPDGRYGDTHDDYDEDDVE